VELVLKVLLGAAVGAAGGYGLSRLRACSATACNVRASTIFSIISGAVFGAAVAWYFLTRP
jgi:hypothetical protein